MNLFISLQRNSLRACCNHKLNQSYKFSKNRIRSQTVLDGSIAIHYRQVKISIWSTLPNIHTNCKYSAGLTDCQYIFFKISYSTGLYANFTAYRNLRPVLQSGCILRRVRPSHACSLEWAFLRRLCPASWFLPRRNAFAGYPLSLDYGPK